MRKVFSYLQGLRGILLILYMMFILCANIYISPNLSDTNKGVMYFVTFAILIVLCPLLMRFLKKLTLKHREVLTTRGRKIGWFCGFFFAALIVLGIYYISFYPGGFSADSINQYREAVTGQYNDWHPVAQTLFSFKLPLTLTGGWVGSIVLFQILLLAGAVAYGAYTILKHGNIGLSALYMIYVLVNPVTECMSMYPWKDVPFAITCVIAASYAVNCYFTKGAWIKTRGHQIAAVIVLAAGTLFRHNAIFFTLPILIAMLLYLHRKAAVALGVCFLAIIFIVKVPVYEMMNVEKPKARACESLGTAMTVLGEVAARNPGALSDEAREFMYRVSPKENWENYYVTGSFNSVKFAANTDYFQIDEEGFFKVLGYAIDAFFKAPKESMRAFISLTDMVYTVTGSVDWINIFPMVIQNDQGIVAGGNPEVLQNVSYVLQIGLNWFTSIYWYIGVFNLILIAFTLAKIRWKKKFELRRLLTVLSVLIYNFGTMVLLSGNDFRFFYFSFLTAPIVLLVLLRDNGADSVDPNTNETTESETEAPDEEIVIPESVEALPVDP